MKKKVYIGAGIVTFLAVLYKLMLFHVRVPNVFPSWMENGIIHIGIAIFAGAIADKLGRRCKGIELRALIALIGAAVIVAISYGLSVGWLYVLCELDYLMEPTELYKMLKGTESIWFHPVLAFCIYAITLICIQKAPQYINSEMTYEEELKREVDEDAVVYTECAPDSDLLTRLRLLRNYEYAISVVSVAGWGQKVAPLDEDVTAYIVSCGYDTVGYFLVRRPSEKECEIVEFFAACNIEKSFQILNIALEKYFGSLGHCSVRIAEVGDLPNAIAMLIEISVMEYTQKNYILHGDGKQLGVYDICFEQ